MSNKQKRQTVDVAQASQELKLTGRVIREYLHRGILEGVQVHWGTRVRFLVYVDSIEQFKRTYPSDPNDAQPVAITE